MDWVTQDLPCLAGPWRGEIEAFCYAIAVLSIAGLSSATVPVAGLTADAGSAENEAQCLRIAEARGPAIALDRLRRSLKSTGGGDGLLSRRFRMRVRTNGPCADVLFSIRWSQLCTPI
jgi:hypothetical protein